MAAGNDIGIVAVLGIGGYLAFEYWQYRSAINTVDQGDPGSMGAAQQLLPFFTYLQLRWGMTSGANGTQTAFFNNLWTPLLSLPGTQ